MTRVLARCTIFMFVIGMVSLSYQPDHWEANIYFDQNTWKANGIIWSVCSGDFS